MSERTSVRTRDVTAGSTAAGYPVVVSLTRRVRGVPPLGG
jgi:hypothetical protein